MRNISLVFILLITFIGSCIDPLDINIDEEVNVLIVEGSITTLPGPHSIRLTQSAKYGSIFDGYVKPVQRAHVYIRDSDGNNFELQESAGRPGSYFTKIGFLPMVGKSYTLLITTAGAIDYTSLPEKINKATELIGLNAEFSSTQIERNKFSDGFDIYATFQDNPEEQNFYMWKNFGDFQLVSLPSDLGIELDCTDGKCWIRKSTDRSIQLLNDNLVNGNIITDQVAFIKEDCVRLNPKFLVRIEQHTLTREAYQFFDLLKDQISINGDIFDPPPATIRGNMINLTNPDDNVIGYFRASDVSVATIYLIK